MNSIEGPWANMVYDILVGICGAEDSQRTDFLSSMRRGCQEYRFEGKLGVGGRFCINATQWYVDCYAVEKSPRKYDLYRKEPSLCMT